MNIDSGQENNAIRIAVNGINLKFHALAVYFHIQLTKKVESRATSDNEEVYSLYMCFSRWTTTKFVLETLQLS